MKIIKTASGKIRIKISKNEWLNIGKKAEWNPKSPTREEEPYSNGTTAAFEEDGETKVGKIIESRFRKGEWCYDIKTFYDEFFPNIPQSRIRINQS